MSTPATTGQIITFYSYKGGTGRSMALANIACTIALAAGKGRGVLVIDWDLEAPGLHRFFQPYLALFNRTQGSDALLEGYPGLLEILSDARQALQANPSRLEGGEPGAIRELLAEIDFDRHLLEVTLPNGRGLTLLKAGRFDAEYGSRVNDFDWEAFFELSPSFFPEFARYLAERFDAVLIDSRTGLTDVSGICTTLMPDNLVVVFTPNEQSLSGLENQIRMATDYRRHSNDLRTLRIFPLASRVEFSEPTLRDRWRFGDQENGFRGYQERFEALFRDIYALPKCDLGPYFDEILIQHVSRYAYGEEIATVVEQANDRLSLSRSYAGFAKALLELRGPWEIVQRNPGSAASRGTFVTDEAAIGSITNVMGDITGDVVSGDQITIMNYVVADDSNDLSQRILTSTIQILNEQGVAAGCGVLVQEGIALTCSHVVTSCGAQPGERILVRLMASGEEVEARISHSAWSPPDEKNIAVIEFESPLPAYMQPAAFGVTSMSLEGHRFRVIGSAEERGPQHMYASGIIEGIAGWATGSRSLQLSSQQFSLGMGGSPVFDEEGGVVVGLLAAILIGKQSRTSQTGIAIPVEELRAAVPDLVFRRPPAIEGYLAAVRAKCLNLEREYSLAQEGQDPYIWPLYFHGDRSPLGASSSGIEQSPKTMDLAELLSRRDPARVIVWGVGGSGKSTLLKHLALQCWDQPLKLGFLTPRLPILVTARQLFKASGPLSERIGQAVENTLALSTPLPDNYLRTWPAQSGADWMLLVDGIDELPVIEQPAFIFWLSQAVSDLPKMDLVLTSRPQPQVLEAYRGWLRATILPLTRFDIARYIQTLARGDEIQRALEGKASFAFLEDGSWTPLGLTLFIFDQRAARAQDNPTRIRAQYLDRVLARMDLRRSEPEIDRRLRKLSRPILSTVALSLLEGSRDDLLGVTTVIADYLVHALGLSFDEAEIDSLDVLRYLLQHSGVLVEIGLDRLGFASRDLQVHLAASAILRETRGDLERLWSRGVSRWDHPDWRGVALEVLGLLALSQPRLADELIGRVPLRNKRGEEFHAEARLRGVGA